MITYRKERFKTIEDYIDTYSKMGITNIAFDRASDYTELFDKNLLWEGCVIRLCNDSGSITQAYWAVDRDKISGCDVNCYSGENGNFHPKDVLDDYKNNWWEIDNIYWLSKVARLINSK